MSSLKILSRCCEILQRCPKPQLPGNGAEGHLAIIPELICDASASVCAHEGFLSRLNCGGTRRQGLLPRGDIAIGLICIVNVRLILFLQQMKVQIKLDHEGAGLFLPSSLSFFFCTWPWASCILRQVSPCAPIRAAPSFVDHTLFVWSWKWRMKNLSCSVGASITPPGNWVLRVLRIHASAKVVSGQTKLLLLRHANSGQLNGQLKKLPFSSLISTLKYWV